MTQIQSSHMKEQDQNTEKLWEELSNITFREGGDGSLADLILNSDWLHFEEGTDREEIWQWFDDQHSKGVAYLLHDYTFSHEKN